MHAGTDPGESVCPIDALNRVTFAPRLLGNREDRLECGLEY